MKFSDVKTPYTTARLTKAGLRRTLPVRIVSDGIVPIQRPGSRSVDKFFTVDERTSVSRRRRFCYIRKNEGPRRVVLCWFHDHFRWRGGRNYWQLLPFASYDGMFTGVAGFGEAGEGVEHGAATGITVGISWLFSNVVKVLIGSAPGVSILITSILFFF